MKFDCVLWENKIKFGYLDKEKLETLANFLQVNDYDFYVETKSYKVIVVEGNTEYLYNLLKSFSCNYNLILH